MIQPKLLSKFNINYDLQRNSSNPLTNDSDYLEISDSSFPEEKDDSGSMTNQIHLFQPLNQVKQENQNTSS